MPLGTSQSEESPGATDAPSAHQPFIPPSQSPPEFTWPAVLTGGILGIIFGASSLYLVLKIGLTVSASVPIAVLSITLFRAFSKVFNVRKATILENNIVQTTGSAGESIAFGVGVTMPALLLLGFEMHWVRVMTVAVLGGLLGILMMIPLRRAFIVKQHGKLVYPEGTACAEVLIAGEKGGATAKMVFIGFGVAFIHKFLTAAAKLWAAEPTVKLYSENAGAKTGLKGAALSGELSPELMGVGFLIGPRIASLMMAGAVLSYFVLGPVIATFGDKSTEPVPPAKWDPNKAKNTENPGLIHNMGPEELQSNYLRFIGAGAVAAGGIISMARAIPLIIGSITAGLRDLRAARAAGGASRAVRTEHDMPMSVVLYGSLALVVALAAVPQLGLGLSVEGLAGAGMILLFGFLFVTVSSRLTGEVGSSSNPISGMTIATLLLVCMIFLLLGRTARGNPTVMLTALMIAAVVCIASSNGGTTSQDLKTGYLVGATPSKQQLGILIGAGTSALIIGGTLLLLNDAQTHYTKKGFPTNVVLQVPGNASQEAPGRPYDRAQQKTDTTPGWQADTQQYRVVFVRLDEYPSYPELKPGRYLVDAAGHPVFRTDMPISREAETMDNGQPAPPKFGAPQPALFANIIRGILGGNLEWALVATGALIAIALELCGVSALPVAVGMYLSLSSSTPIFIGGMVRLVADMIRGKPRNEAEAETSPGVLLASGYIAGGTLCGLLVITLFAFIEPLQKALDLGALLTGQAKWNPDEVAWAKGVAVVMFGLLGAFLLWIGSRREKEPVEGNGAA